jgi:hypothetical protein
MATVKKGILTSSPQWWKHLRSTKRQFWSRERKAAERDAQVRVDEVAGLNAIDAEIDWIMQQEEREHGQQG